MQSSNWQTLLFSATPPPPLTMVVAHPDDEVIGAGAQLRRWTRTRVLCVTDGAPRNGVDASAAGFAGASDYAFARKQESQSALALAGLGGDTFHGLEYPDQEASLHLAALSRQVAGWFLEWNTSLVVTQPYEGGHPDHDAIAFAVHAARDLLLREHRRPISVIECAAYHRPGDALIAGEFLSAENEVLTVTLSPEQRAFKRCLFDCFRTQQKVLAQFRIETERFRLAPRYDFTAPPHAGLLYYERFDWGMTGTRWRRLALEALDELESHVALHP